MYSLNLKTKLYYSDKVPNISYKFITKYGDWSV